MNWKTFKEKLPSISLLSVFILLLSLIHQMVYYHYFGIKIQYFIGITELPIVICDELTGTLIFICLITFIALIYLKDANIRIKLGLEAEGKISTWKLFIGEFIGASIWIVLHVIFFKVTFGGILLFWVFLYPVIFFYIAFYYKKKQRTFDNNLVHLAFLCLLLIIELFNLTAIDIRNANRGIYTGTKIFTKDSTYVSDKNHFYIGKTQNYYFIYNKDSSTLVIPEREVMKFDLRSNW